MMPSFIVTDILYQLERKCVALLGCLPYHHSCDLIGGATCVVQQARLCTGGQAFAGSARADQPTNPYTKWLSSR